MPETSLRNKALDFLARREYSVKELRNKISKYSDNSEEVGATSGTVLGAIVGSGAAGRAAGGDGETSEQIGAIVGGLVGSVVGSEVGESISRKKGVEIIIKLDSNNREVAIVQEASEDEALEVKAGDKVRIIRSAGRSRVVPYN